MTRVSWICRAGEEDGGTIYDRLIQKTLSGVEITPCALTGVGGRAAQLTGMVRGLAPHDRAPYKSAANRDLALAASADADVVVISHEGLDWLSRSIRKPTVLLLHNVTSDYARRFLRDRPVGRVLHALYSRYERGVYAARPGLALVGISEMDKAVLAGMTRAPLFMAQPGMPPVRTLSPTAGVSSRLAISGTYDWVLKRSGLARFADEYQTAGLRLEPMFDQDPPDFLKAKVADWRSGEMNPSGDLAFGLVTDRFEAGFKLKVGAYIANNLITLSFSDVGADYEGLPHATEFIRRVHSAADIEPVIRSVLAEDAAGVVDRFRTFQAAAAARFTWRRASDAVSSAIEAAIASARS